MRKYALIAVIVLSVASPALAVPLKYSQISYTAACPDAVLAADRVVAQGGNVFDVAVVMALTMAVTRPSFAALGGGGFALFSFQNKVEVLDFREKAPQVSEEDFYKNLPENASTVGARAVAVPGMVAGLYELHNKRGKLSWKKLFVDPIRLAEKGFRVSGDWVEDTLSAEKKFNSIGKKYFFKKDGRVYLPGELIKQKSLAKALKIIRDLGPKGFYRGAVAKDLVESLKKEGGVITRKDLESYSTVYRKPVITSYESHKIYLMPPPSSGGIVIATALRLAEKLDLKSEAALSVPEAHKIAEILKMSYRGRSLMGDPDFVKKPFLNLLNDSYLEGLAKDFSNRKAIKIKPLGNLPEESSETTHLSVLDKDGNSVAMTITLNGNYGSGMVTEKYGIALNNEMDDFTTKPGEPNMFGLVQGAENKIEPGKRPLSSMSPTLVEKDGKIVMSLGAPGGPRIISGVYQVLFRTLGQGMDIDRAIQAPRVHHQFLPDTVFYDGDYRFSPEVISSLEKKGHLLKAGWMGRVFGIYNKDKVLNAAFDSRGEGAIGGH